MPTAIEERFHYSDGKSVEGGRTSRVYRNMAGLGDETATSFRLDVFQLQERLAKIGYSTPRDGSWDLTTEVALGDAMMPVDETWSVDEPEGSKMIFVHPGTKEGISADDIRSVWTAFRTAVSKERSRPTRDPVAFSASDLQKGLRKISDSSVPAVTGSWNLETDDALIANGGAPIGTFWMVLDSEGYLAEYGDANIQVYVVEGSATFLDTITTAIQEVKAEEAVRPPIPTPTAIVSSRPVPTTTAPVLVDSGRRGSTLEPEAPDPNADLLFALEVAIPLKALGIYRGSLDRTAAEVKWRADGVLTAFQAWADARNVALVVREYADEPEDEPDTLRLISPGGADGPFDKLNREAEQHPEQLSLARQEAGVCGSTGDCPSGFECVDGECVQAVAPRPRKEPWGWIIGGIIGLGVITYYAAREG